MTASEPVAAMLAGGRLHLQHGPIDLVIEAWATERSEVALAYEQARLRFRSILTELVEELPRLRAPVREVYPLLYGAVARRMVAAVWPYRAQFITPMAAVAGAVADEILAATVQGRALARAYVNNGGDIAVHLAPGASLRVGIAKIENAKLAAVATVQAAMPVRGIATSGWRGRSFSLGIADSVSILASTAAMADAAATVVANAVNIPHPGIARVPANSLQPESDLGELPVTRGVPELEREDQERALDHGAATARRCLAKGMLYAALLCLQGRSRALGGSDTIRVAPGIGNSNGAGAPRRPATSSEAIVP
jgi:ApbE superfamily uncharacterized protein (UPF0280 family)